MNYPDLDAEFDIIGELPDGKYEGVAFMNKAYLVKGLDAYSARRAKRHPMADKCINLIWVRLPTKEAFERLNATGRRPIRRRSSSAARRSSWRRRRAASARWMAAYKDIFWGMKYILVAGDDRRS